MVKVPGSHYGEIEISDICFYLHPKSTLDKRKKNYKYFLNSSCQSLPYFLSSEPLNSLALDQYLEYPHRGLRWNIHDVPPSQLTLCLAGISKNGKRGKLLIDLRG